MKKLICAAVAVLSVLVLLCSCGTIITTNTERDMAQVIVKVNGDEILKKDFYNIYLNYVYQYYYGYGISPSDSRYASFFKNQANSILNTLIQNKIEEQKAVSLGYLDGLTEEEKKECRDKAEADIEQAVRESALSKQTAAEATTAPPATETPEPTATPEPTETPEPTRTPKPAPTPVPTATPEPEIAEKYLEEARQDYDKGLEEAGQTREDIYKQYYMEKAIEKMKDALSADAAKISDDEAKQAYDTLLSTQQTEYTGDPTKVESATGTIVYYPAGYGRYKNLLVQIDSTAQSAISALRTEANTAKTNSEKDGISDEEKAEYLKTYEEKTAEADAKLNEELATIVDRATDLLAAATAEGADFDALILEQGEDTGMITTDEDGNRVVVKDDAAYLIGPETSKYVTAFKDASLALENVGDVSGLVATDYGYHIIKKVAAYEEGAVPFETVKETIVNNESTKAVDAFLTDLSTQWLQEAKIEKHYDRLKDIIDVT